jgi:hypothetical protein
LLRQKSKGWTIPENLLKEIVDLEAILVVIIERHGGVQGWVFEKELNEHSLEPEICFTPDLVI